MKDKAWPNWGRVDTHIWLGKVWVEQGRLEEAGSAYEHALDLAPDHAWIKNELMPELERIKLEDQ